MTKERSANCKGKTTTKTRRTSRRVFVWPPNSFVKLSVEFAQSLLPHLWQSGALGGRSFDVLLSRTPLNVLAARLDEAFEASDDATLGDFRAPLEFVRAERAALNQANRVFSPHALAAREFGPRAWHLEWMMPQAKAIEPDAPRDCLVFPGPAVARKGAQAVRDAVRELKMPLVIVGRDFMGADFWRGVELRVLSPGEPWLPYAHVVVQPALIEHEPRALLHAVAAKVPVIATPQCGLGEREGVAPVAFGDEQSLVEAVRIALRTSDAGVAE